VTTVDSTIRFLLLGQLRHLRDRGFDVSAISAPGPWVEEVEAQGIRHIVWRHATRSWNPLADVAAFLELLGIFRRERFDVVHTHNPKPGLLGRIAARLAGVPCVVNTVHGLYATRQDPLHKRAAVLALERVAAWFSDVELYQSEEDLRWARTRGVVRGSRSLLLGNGADLARFDPSVVSPERLTALRRELGLTPTGPVVGTVARLVREKGYRELFTAAAAVRAVFPEARFLVLGEPDRDKPDAITDAEMEEARRHVAFAGWRTDVPEALALMDVFVLPTWREGVPRSAIEAAAMGKSLVLTDVRGCREVARDGVEGILVPPRDGERLAEAIIALLQDPSLRQRLGEAARARAVERFDEHRVSETVSGVYGSLLARKGLLSEERTVGGSAVGGSAATETALDDLRHGRDGRPIPGPTVES
jgi:glycosyltransferase involved in cell wall biosynthesis